MLYYIVQSEVINILQYNAQSFIKENPIGTSVLLLGNYFLIDRKAGAYYQSGW